MSSQLRQQIEQATGKAHWKEVFALAGDLWRMQPSTSTASYLLSIQKNLEHNLPFWRSCKVAVLRSLTVEPVIPLLRAEALVHGIGIDVYVSGFNEYVQDILRADSGLYQFHPDVTILAVQTRDLAPELWDTSADCSPAALREAADHVVSSFRAWIETFRSFCGSYLIIHSLECPGIPASGLFDMQCTDGQSATLANINRALVALAKENPGVFVLDYGSLVSRLGKANWHDERKWLAMRMPFSAQALISMAREWFRFICPLSGKIAKVLVTDLDNTLWGGVVGEDGVENLQVGTEYGGAPYRAVQRALLDLNRRGVLLAICSKNDHQDAVRALEERDGMLLRAEHFACVRANWNDKVQNLREIAAELNVGVDALAFLDDNPAERARVRGELPEVTVIELSQDSMTYADAVRNEPALERLTISEEDRERRRYYAEQKQRAEYAAGASTLEEFYASLQQTVEIRRAGTDLLARVAQLTQKTNQFNLTTRRYSGQDIERLCATPGWAIYSVRARDRFGESGIVGVAILHTACGEAEIDTLLLSCRVIGRGIETALLAFLVDECRAGGFRQLQGWFYPTAKNSPAAEFYLKHGFAKAAEKPLGTLWTLAVADAQIECPAWIALNAGKEAPLANYAHS